MSTETATETIATVSQAEAIAREKSRHLEGLQESIKRANQPADVLRLRKEIEEASFEVTGARIFVVDAKIAETEQRIEAARAEVEALEAQIQPVVEEVSLAQELLNQKIQAKNQLGMRLSMAQFGVTGQTTIVQTLRKERETLMAGLIEGATK